MDSDEAVAYEARTDGPDSGPGPGRSGAASEPFGANGAEADRDPATGRFRPGNKAALVAGEFSASFWREAQAELAARRAALLADRGHTTDDAPEALRAAVDGAVQATLLRDAAFMRVADSGGPTTLRGRSRAAFRTWLEAGDRAERYLRLLGLHRRAKPAFDLARALSGLPQGDGE